MTEKTEEEREIPLRCHRCGYEWTYKGKMKWYASCPQCRTSVKIEKQRLDK